MNRYLLEQYKLHPSMQPQDVIKMCYQAVFGADHLLSDIEGARRYFHKEYNSTEAADVIVFENISDDYARVNLAGWKHEGHDPEKLFSEFVKAAGKTEGTDELFLNLLRDYRETLKSIWDEKKLEQMDNLCDEYLKNGIRAVHHSEEYRHKENPAYRIVLKKGLISAVKIKVMRMANYQDLIDEYENPLENACMMHVGEEFISHNGNIPEGFCESAWENLAPYVRALSLGERNLLDGWMKNGKAAMVSCNDGFRPVSFLVEAVV